MAEDNSYIVPQLFPLIEHDVPIFLIEFPRLIRDPDYLFRKLQPLMNDHSVSYSEVLEARGRIAHPELIHDFIEPSKEPSV